LKKRAILKIAEAKHRSLVQAAERWLLARGVDEIHSDAIIENRVSQSSHHAIGFVEVERLVHFRKKIQNIDKC